jgi:hypothetical protein
VIALARAEEQLVEAHVRNALELLDAVGDELPLDQVVEIYLESLDVSEPRSSIVARRALARLEAGARERADHPAADADG